MQRISSLRGKTFRMADSGNSDWDEHLTQQGVYKSKVVKESIHMKHLVKFMRTSII